MSLESRIKNKINSSIFEVEMPFPKKNLLIEVTNNCNNKCVFCYNDCMKRNRGFIDKDLCFRVLKEAYELGMREVGFYVTGEPLLDKRLTMFIKRAKEIGYTYIYITTNGILANLDRVKKLYDAGLNSIKYSINASNREDYLLIHGTDNFNKVIKNLSEVYDWKKKNNINIKLYVSYITVDLTNKEKEIDKLFKNSCDEYIVMSAINQGGLIPDICSISHSKEAINSNFKIPCSYPFKNIIVTWEGYLTGCCMDFENLLAYADLNKESLSEAWNNKIIKDFRKKQLKGDVKKTICDNCIYNKKSVPKALSNKLCNLSINKDIFCKDIERVRRINESN